MIKDLMRQALINGNKKKYCRDCKWLIQPGFLDRFFYNFGLRYAKCGHPDAFWTETNGLVEGTIKKHQMHCSSMRKDDFPCGKEGKFWEPKE